MPREEKEAVKRKAEQNFSRKEKEPHSIPDRVFAWVVPGTALGAFFFAILSGLGHRIDWWSFRSGFLVLKWAVYAAIVVLVLSAIGMYRSRPGRSRPGFSRSLLTFLLSAAIIAVPGYWVYRAKTVPRIHDITTDTADPPQFVALLPLREATPNGAAYSGLEVALQQQEAYPDIDTELVASAPAETFEKALSVVKNMQWEIVAADPEDLRVEATDTTFWFGFKDDIVIRIRPMDMGSRLDIRSISRVGLSDVGANAARIRRFLEDVRKK